MKPSPSALVLFGLLAVAGCYDDMEPVPTRLDDAVQMANREPGPACCGLEAVEVRSTKSQQPTYDALRAYATTRHANYVVVDTFSVYDMPDDEAVLTRARLYRCPPPQQLAP
jgi:hypothetical protein